MKQHNRKLKEDITRLNLIKGNRYTDSSDESSFDSLADDEESNLSEEYADEYGSN